MNTFLLTWNPKRWEWEEIDSAIKATKKGDTYSNRWSCNTKQIHVGDRVFLIRVGAEPRGIVASGYVTSELYESKHWDDEKREKGMSATRIDVDFDVVLDAENESIIHMNELKKGILSEQHWSSQSSGIRIKNEIAVILEKKWEALQRLRNNKLLSLPGSGIHNIMIEGGKKQITINSYERNSKARKQCLEHYGPQCVVCGFNSVAVYGNEFEGKIHVHHIKPLNEIDEEYIVDPVNDLVPVCPNCHMILHIKEPAYLPDEVKNKLASQS